MNIFFLVDDLFDQIQVGEVVLRKIVEVWLETEFSGGRHQRRVNKIADIEKFCQNKINKEINEKSQSSCAEISGEFSLSRIV